MRVQEKVFMGRAVREKMRRYSEREKEQSSGEKVKKYKG
jgi:hypothetical protein